jgi:hypothetical protein
MKGLLVVKYFNFLSLQKQNLHYMLGEKLPINQYNETNVMHYSLNSLRFKGHLHVSRITCSSSGGGAQTALGISRAY